MAYNTIKIKKYSDHIEEFAAAAAITPGMLIELTSSETVQAHSVSGGNVTPVMIALEDELQGNGISDAYVAGDRVQCWIPYPGDMFYGLLEDGQKVVIGDKLESNGAGYLQKHAPESWESADAQAANTIYSKPIVGIALEAQDLSTLEGSESSLAENSQRIKVMVV